MRYVIVILFAAALMLSATTAFSYGRGTVDVDIISDRGDEFSVIPFKDFETGSTHIIKKYLEAKRGENYGIVIRNNTQERIGVVVAVDGRNIITGKKSFLKNAVCYRKKNCPKALV